MTTTTAEESALLRAVLESPCEDAPRLVYADWLEERGEAARAEFVRVQIELAGLPRPETVLKPARPPVYARDASVWRQYNLRVREYRRRRRGLKPAAERYESLRRRELDLWRRLPTAAAFAPFAAGIATDPDAPRFWLGDQGGPLCEVCRGFVETVHCRLADWCGGPCGRCDGEGGQRHITCGACGGTGGRPALGPAVVAAQPVTGVELADLRPQRSTSHEFGWWGSDVLPPGENVPLRLWDFLPGRGPNWAWYPTEAAARAALSRAAVSWARDEAGLPELTWPGADSTT